MRLEEGFKNGANHLLGDAVSDRGNAQRTKFAIPFWDEDPSERGGVITVIVLEDEHQGGKIVVEIGFESANADLIHPGSAAIAFDGLEGRAHPVAVNPAGEGVEFRQLVGQATFLTALRYCEVTG